MDENFSLERSAVIRWKVKANFSSSEPESHVFDFNGSSWSFKLAKLRHAPECIGICLLKKDSNSALSQFSIFAFIEDRNKRAHFPCGWCRPANYFWWCKYTDLLANDGISQFNDGITLCFVLSPETTSEAETETGTPSAHQATTNAEEHSCMETLTLDLRHLLDDGTHSDVTLKCGDSTTPAHGCILSARSKVFSAMLRSDMVESRNGVIEISDMDPPAFSQFLQFIYSGKLSDLSMATAPELYAAGDKYNIQSLKGQCSGFMRKNLTEENACNVLILADAHNDGELKECAVSFILKAELMRNDDIWLKFCEDHPKLAIEILNRPYRRLKK